MVKTPCKRFGGALYFLMEVAFRSAALKGTTALARQGFETKRITTGAESFQALCSRRFSLPGSR
jgi:hypothetical protein